MSDKSSNKYTEGDLVAIVFVQLYGFTIIQYVVGNNTNYTFVTPLNYRSKHNKHYEAHESELTPITSIFRE